MSAKSLFALLLCGMTLVANAETNIQKVHGYEKQKHHQQHANPPHHHQQKHQQRGTVIYPSDGYYLLSTNCNNSYYISMRAGISGNRIGLDDREEPLYIKRVGDYYYIYDDANKGLALDLNTGKAINGGRIQFYIPNASNAQKWRFIQYPDGSVVIESAQDSRYVLDVPQSYASRGTRIHLYQYNGNSNQRWTLKKYNGQFRLDRNHRKDNYRPTPKPVVKPVEVSAGHGRK